MDRFRSIGRPSVRPSVRLSVRRQCVSHPIKQNQTKSNREIPSIPERRAARRSKSTRGSLRKPPLGDDPSSKSRFVNRENIFLKKRIKLWIESKLILFTHTKMTTKRRVCDSFCPSQCARAREIQRRNATSGAATKRGRHTTTRRPAEEHGHSNVTLHLGCI